MKNSGDKKTFICLSRGQLYHKNMENQEMCKKECGFKVRLVRNKGREEGRRFDSYEGEEKKKQAEERESEGE